LISNTIKRKHVVRMKSLPGVLTQPRGAVALFCILAAAALTQFPTHCRAEATPHKTVTIENEVILLHPGTRLTKPDQKALNQILARYDKSLYKVETYKKGNVTRTQGELSDMLIDKTLAAEAADAKAKGYSNRTLQIIAATTSQRLLGSTTNPQQTPGTTTNPLQTPGTTTNPQTSPSATTNPQTSPSATTNPQTSPSATTNPQTSPSATTNPQRSPGATTNPQTTASATTNPQTTASATTNPQTTASATTNPQTTASVTTNPQQQSPSPVGEKASRELIERLKPILEKYSK
jgi:hypothetical protein